MREVLTSDPVFSELIASSFVRDRDYITERESGCQSWLAIYTAGGRGVFNDRNATYLALPGSLALLRPQRFHRYFTDPAVGEWSLQWIHFHPRPEWGPALAWTPEPHAIVTVDLEPAAADRVSGLFAQSESLMRAGRPADRDLAMAYCHAMLLEGRRGAGDRAAGSDNRYSAALDFIHQSYAQIQATAEIARAVGLSESRLGHLFRTLGDSTPREYVERVRLEEARRRLIATDLPISRIAGQVGFANEFYFSNRYRARFGMSPRDYRQTYRRNL